MVFKEEDFNQPDTGDIETTDRDYNPSRNQGSEEINGVEEALENLSEETETKDHKKVNLSHEMADTESIQVSAHHFYTTLNAPLTTPGKNTPEIDVEDPKQKSENLTEYLKQGGIETLETAYNSQSYEDNEDLQNMGLATEQDLTHLGRKVLEQAKTSE